MLKELEIFGFKSFAQRTKLSFPRPNEEYFGITAIVGPNGSGKSNLVEAIQWVLGEQSQKTLRSHLSQDLIFAGSPSKKPANYAEVKLSLENKIANDLWPLIQIKRRLWRSGESEYLINENKVRLSDIENTLFKINFGKYNYSIIGQGDIARLFNLSPRARKEFFDEATGIKPYLKKIEISSKKIEKTKENLNHLKIALKEISPQLSYLSRQVEKLKKRQELKQKLFKLEKDFYQAQIKKIDHNLAERQKRIPLLQEEIKILKKEIEENEKKIQSFSSSKLSDQWSELQAKYQEKEREKNQLSQEMISLNLKIQSLENSYSTEKLALNLEIGLLFQKLEKIEKKINNLLSNILNNNPSVIKQELEELLSNVRVLLSYFEKQKPDETINEKKEKFFQSKKIISQKLEKIEKEIKGISSKLSNLGQEEDKIRQSFRKWEEKNQKLRKDLELKENDLQENKINLARLEEKQNNLYQEISKELGKDNLEKIIKISKEKTDYPLEEYQEKGDEIANIKRELLIIGEIDPEVEKEYPKVSSRYNFLKKESDDLKKSLRSLNKIIAQLEKRVKEQFEEQFKKINKIFNDYFKRFFGGGQARLIPIKSEEDELNGIEIEASLPGKKIKSIKTLSGGEKTLTSLALISAILSLNKPPFAVYDEVDAALDEENSLRFGEILKEINKDTQLIVVSHNRQTIQAADILYGITMGQDGASKILSLQLSEGTSEGTVPRS